MGDLTANFSRSEFECKCGCGLCIADYALVTLLQDLRERYGRVVHVQSGTRCESHNTASGGYATSKHMVGLAADIVVSGIAPDEVHAQLVEWASDRWGIGSYDEFTHIDVRPVAARWNG